MLRLSLLALATCAVVGCHYERDLSGPEISALLNGSTVTGHHDLHGYSFRRVYVADRFDSYNNGAAVPRTARWWVAGDQVCIRWDGEPRDLCRYITTDDRGHYYKEMVNRRGRRRRIVTYQAFVGADGRDRRVILSSGPYARRWLGTWRGLAILLVLALAAGFASWRLLRGKDDPTSIRNRFRRRFATLHAGGQSYRWGQLKRGRPEILDRFTYDSARDGELMQVFWAFELMRTQADGDDSGAWERLWRCLESLPDDTIIAAFGETLRTPRKLAVPRPDNLRFAYLLGQAFTAQAREHQRDATRFPRLKDGAVALLGHVRERAQTPPPDLVPAGSPYRGTTAPPATDYAALAGSAFEAAMYMQLIAPAPSKAYSSSSHAGGG